MPLREGNGVLNEGSPEVRADGSRASVQRLFDDTRRRLVETGTRNRLVHVNRANTRGHVVTIVNERSDEVHALLCGGKAMRFRALGHDRPQAGEVVLADEAEADVGAERWTDTWLETQLGPDALAKKLLKIAGEARTAEEEQGVNILYLALGFLTWFEDGTSSVAREAPLVLLPVELVRNQRTSSFDLRLREEELLTNLPLQQRLRDDFGIALPPIEMGEDWRPGDYHAAVEAIVADRPRWRVDRDAMQLGFFSFSKLLMYLDLSLDAWPDGALEAHGLTRGLLFEGFDAEPPLFGPDVRLDEALPPERMVHVVDADASQAKVIEEVRAGRNLVVQGPPGTGKSQTITNIIAAAANEGRTVLFVAEKMAALSVVHDRLVKVGLRDLCLELHSRTANKKAVLGELARTLNAAAAAPAMPGPPERLRQARDRLNAIADALHAPIGATGETPFSVLGRQVRYLGQGAPSPTIDAAGLATLGRAEERALVEGVAELGGLLSRAGPLDAHPFAGVRAIDLQPTELARLRPQLLAASEDAARLHAALDTALTAAGVPAARALGQADAAIDLLDRLGGLPPGGVALARRLVTVADHARLTEALAGAAEWRTERDAADGLFTEAAFAGDASPAREGLVAGASSWWARWFGGGYRAASRTLAGLLAGPMPGGAAERLLLLDRLLRVQALRRRWGEDEAFLAAVLGEAWRGERTDFAAAAAVADWAARAAGGGLEVAPDRRVDLAADPAQLRAMRDALAESTPRAGAALKAVAETLALDALGESVELRQVEARLTAMAGQIDRYGEWARITRLLARLDAAGLRDLGTRMAAGALDAEAATIELRFARAERLWNDAVRASPALREIAALDRHALAAQFAGLERARLKDNVRTILAGHLAQVPQGAMGEMKIVRGEIGRRRGYMALRRLFATAPTALQRIKPVLLMSPISVAQYLTPGTLKFDLLIIDEASQVRPEDALGAIARAEQIVVVGDQKQLPPTSFFDRLLADEESTDEPEGDEEDLLGGAAKLDSMESILSLCEARMPSQSRMLQWHYRSRDPSLIRVSNREFYRDELILPPSPLERDPAFGLTFTRVDGVYDKGGKRDNRGEGEAIVARIAQHARAHPDLSLGVVTFSSAQKNTITELLERARRTDQALDAFLREGRREDVFVKNIENVQGDERDVILVSVGYGPTVTGGRLSSMSFGPVNGEGGERRLNVLFTRARIRCEVFASFDPGDIDAARVSRDGPRILKRFLEFARSGKLDEALVTGAPPDTPFEEDVADVVRSFGYLADPQVGSAGFRIDLGVRHPDKPGTYLLAVECDGATYHGALWARERDRLRQDVLEHLGWRFHRIWSTDWFHRRREEIERLRTALAQAREAAEAGVRLDGANRGGPAMPLVAASADAAIVVPEAIARTMPPYARALFPVRSHLEPHEAPVAMLAELAARIVAAEGPIHLDEVARRVASSFGKEKAGARILAAVRGALLGGIFSTPDLHEQDGFWFTSAQRDKPPVRDRSAESGATLKACNISLPEIHAALRIAREDNAGGGEADLIRTAARLLGFRRVGPDLQLRIAEALQTIE